MDGMLSFFEQEMFAFGRFLPGFLLPSPVRYIAKTDSFVTCSSSRLVECYKYVQYYDSAEEFNYLDLKLLSSWAQNLFFLSFDSCRKFYFVSFYNGVFAVKTYGLASKYVFTSAL